jgi:hypothetical protein
MGHWFSEAAALDAAGDTAHDAGELYLNLHTPANPGGELRGQIIAGNVQLTFTDMSGAQEVPSVSSSASGVGATTYNPDTGAIVVHVNSSGADDAVAAHVHQAFAGTNGGVMVGLVQDENDPGHWFSEAATLDAAGQTALDAGELYLNLHTPANPGGELRGQIIAGNVQLTFSDMSGAQEVPAVSSSASGIGATTYNPGTGAIVVHVNSSGVNDAVAAHVHQGSAGTNGGVLFGLVQDLNNMGHWLSEAATLDAAGATAHDSGELYLNLHTPANTGGEIRGQIVP